MSNLLVNDNSYESDNPLQKETECIDQDLMNLTVTSLSKDTFNRQNSDRSGVVAYYINRFIVKTAGNATFERIQSNSFSDTRRSVDYEAEECPISLNYYDCKEFPDISELTLYPTSGVFNYFV